MSAELSAVIGTRQVSHVSHISQLISQPPLVLSLSKLFTKPHTSCHPRPERSQSVATEGTEGSAGADVALHAPRPDTSDKID